jgi:hypothetical protein
MGNKWKAYDLVRTFTGTVSGSYFTGTLYSRILDYNGEAVYEKAIEVNNEYLPGLSMVEYRGPYSGFLFRQYYDDWVYSDDDLYYGSSAGGWPNDTFEELYEEMNYTRFIHSLGTYLPDKTKPEEVIHYEQRHKVNSDPSFKEYDAWVTVETKNSRKSIKLLGMPENPWRWTGNHREIDLDPQWRS